MGIRDTAEECPTCKPNRHTKVRNTLTHDKEDYLDHGKCVSVWLRDIGVTCH